MSLNTVLKYKSAVFRVSQSGFLSVSQKSHVPLDKPLRAGALSLNAACPHPAAVHCSAVEAMIPKLCPESTRSMSACALKLAGSGEDGFTWAPAAARSPSTCFES